MSRYFILFLVLIAGYSAFSQQVSDSSGTLQQDSVPVTRDTTVVIKDSIPPALPIAADSVSKIPANLKLQWKTVQSVPLQFQILDHHPYLGFSSQPTGPGPGPRQQRQGKETLFYVLTGLFLLFAILKGLFPKYFNDLFRLFFRTTLKQRQIKEQLMQTPLPSLLMNLFFVVAAGLYADLILLHYRMVDESIFWTYFLYCCLALSVIYLVKFIGLKILGWIFNFQGAADAYIFIVFIVNKVIGVFLLPFLVVLAFVPEPGYSTALLLSWIGVGCLLVYRFVLTYAALRNQVRFNLFHFFLYICAFEMAPLLLIYKLLLAFFY